MSILIKKTMKVNQVKELNQVTIIYSENDKKELQEYLKTLKNDYYCFNYEDGLYQFRKRISPKIPRRKNNEKNKYTGVFKPKKATKHVAQVSINGKNEYLGSFDTEEQAHEYRMNYINKLKN